MEFLGANAHHAALASTQSVVRLNVPVRRLADALPLMADVALRPTFPAAELDRLRQERLTALLQARDDPQPRSAPPSRASCSARRTGTASAAKGTDATLKAFTPAELQAFHAAHYRPGNATLDRGRRRDDGRRDAAAREGVRRVDGRWRQCRARAGADGAAADGAADLPSWTSPSAAQSQIRIGWVGVPRSTPDYFALQVLNTILGGSFTSRLNQNLREEHGYSYGASSRFDMRLSAGPFLAGAACRPTRRPSRCTSSSTSSTGLARQSAPTS